MTDTTRHQKTFCGIQLDLKYHMPNKAYLASWIKRLPEFGIDTLLIEYEDMFPYQRYPFLASPDAFTPDELRHLLATARAAGLTPIPLIQTYAHLEFALAHPELAHLRELPEIEAKVCAQHPESAPFVRSLIEEILAYHEEDPYVHLGGDEVWHTDWCPACTARIDAVGPMQMWVDHEKPLLELVIARGKRPIVWDDIFWKDFDSIGTLGLPQETILHAWNYNITSLQAKNSDPTDIELGGAGGVLKQVDAYRDAGFASIAGPCYNVGQLFTRHSHSIKNTQVWAQKMRDSQQLGMLNTAWAVFHIPLQMLNLQVAATGALCRDPDAIIDTAWQQRWLEAEFGTTADGVPAALEILGAGWEIPTPAFQRPFTPLVYGYMNMVFHYPGRHKDRQRRGPYPHDWSEIDFWAMYKTGLAEARKYPEQDRVAAALDDRLASFPQAVAALDAMAHTATRHAADARMMAVFAHLKYLSLRIVALHLRGHGDAATLRHELDRLADPLQHTLADAWEPIGAARMRRAFYEPMIAALEPQER